MKKRRRTKIYYHTRLSTHRNVFFFFNAKKKEWNASRASGVMMLATDLKLALCDVAGCGSAFVANRAKCSKIKFELYFSKSAKGRTRNAASCRAQLRLMGRLITCQTLNTWFYRLQRFSLKYSPQKCVFSWSRREIHGVKLKASDFCFQQTMFCSCLSGPVHVIWKFLFFYS